MKLPELKKSALAEIEKTEDIKTLEKIRVKYLGRKGELSRIFDSLKNLPIEKRKEIGPRANQLKKEIENLISRKVREFVKESPRLPQIDITRPGKKMEFGHLHPLTLVEEKVRDIFAKMHFAVVDGPEIETEFYNFTALNIPENHPAREMWDTFWLRQNELKNRNSKIKIKERLLLRTHTSPVQIRYMETHNPPCQIIAPGRTYRYEATDKTHDFQFNQFEGLMVGKDVSIANFKQVIGVFFNHFFGRETEFELRPAYFPFVEPGWEVYLKWDARWLEVAGAGMVHPRVFEAIHYNPRDWQGFAFGSSIERLAMIKYKIEDIRLFNSGDLRFIKQF